MFTRNLESGPEAVTIGDSVSSFVSRHAERRLRTVGSCVSQARPHVQIVQFCAHAGWQADGSPRGITVRRLGTAAKAGFAAGGIAVCGGRFSVSSYGLRMPPRSNPAAVFRLSGPELMLWLQAGSRRPRPRRWIWHELVFLLQYSPLLTSGLQLLSETLSADWKITLSSQKHTIESVSDRKG
jgi:hypothetical protein